MCRWFVALVALFFGCAVAAQEHPACLDRVLGEREYSTDELLAVARSCRSPVISELYFNRAYHRRQLQEYQRFERSLQHYGNEDYRSYIESYRIHIALAEAFASARLARGDEATVRRLNRVYDESAEIAELRFKGYDLIADRLEERIRL